MSRPRGGLIVGTLPTWTTTATSGIFSLREAQSMRTTAQWPRGPAAPTNLTASAGNAQLSLSWTAPANAHGTITNYLVEYTASGGSAQYVLTNSTSTLYTLTGLTNGTAYTVRVAAVNFTAGDYSGTDAATPSAELVSIEAGQYIVGSGTVGDKYRVTQTSGPNVFLVQQNATIYWSGMDQSGEWDGDMNYWNGFNIRKNGTGTPTSAAEAGVNAWSGSVLVASSPSSGSAEVSAGDQISIAMEIRWANYFGLGPNNYTYKMLTQTRIWFIIR